MVTRSPDASEGRFWVTSAGMPLLSTAGVPADGEEKIEWVRLKKDMMNIICDLKNKCCSNRVGIHLLTFLL